MIKIARTQEFSYFMIIEEYYSAGCAVGLLQRELGFSSAILRKCLNSLQAMFFVFPKTLLQRTGQWWSGELEHRHWLWRNVGTPK